MLLPFSQLCAFQIKAADGRLGAIRDIYLDDRDWVIRYFSLHRPGARSPIQTLICPRAALTRLDAAENALTINLPVEQVEAGPDFNPEDSLSRRVEREVHEHYGWAPHWNSTHAAVALHGPRQEARRIAARNLAEEEFFDPRLRSATSLRGYRVGSSDADSATVDDLLIKPGDWSVAFVVVQIRCGRTYRKIVVPTEAIGGISGMDQRVYLELSQEELFSRPELPGSGIISDGQETELRRFDELDSLDDYPFGRSYGTPARVTW